MGWGGIRPHLARFLRCRIRTVWTFSRGSVRNHDDQQNGLEPIEPTTARDIYLDHKQTECAEATVYNHRFRLKPFFE